MTEKEIVQQKDNQILRLQKEVEKLKKSIKNQKYGIVWADVPEAFEDDVENKLPVLEEVPKLAIKSNDNKPTHILIEGDNYHALTCLNYTHKGKVDVIYIDPPYNTGSDGFRYKDKRILDKFPDGTEVPKDHPFRHSYWLSFMKKRLELARDILSQKGAIFISIDDNEYAQLKLLCDEVFGESNFVSSICVKMSHLSGVKMSHLEKKLPKLKEYLLIYSKNKHVLDLQPVYENADAGKAFSRYKSFLVRDEKKPSDITKWKVISLNKAMREADVDTEDEVAVNEFYLKNANNIFRTARNRSEQFTSLPKDDLFRNVVTATGLKKIAYKAEEVVFVSSKLQGEAEDASLMQPLGDIWTDIGINNLHNEGGVDFRNGKKPLKLIERVISMLPKKDSVVLDFFAGSGTTAQAVLQANAEDNGSRQFILITNNEGKIMSDVCYPRVKNAIRGFKGNEGLGGSVKYYKSSFVGKHNILDADDKDKLQLAYHAGEMLSIAENTLEITEKTDHWQIFESKDRHTAVYFKEEYDELDDFIKKVKKLSKPVSVYIFSWEDDPYIDDFEDNGNITVKTIPQPILEIYKQIYNLL